MNQEQELRAWSLAIAAIMLGTIPESSNLSHRPTYEPYIGLAQKIERYIVSEHPLETQ
jgi:hypothetical protein